MTTHVDNFRYRKVKSLAEISESISELADKVRIHAAVKCDVHDGEVTIESMTLATEDGHLHIGYNAEVP